MQTKRRQILKMAATLPLGLHFSAGLAKVDSKSGSSISFVKIKDNAIPALQPGDRVLVDTEITHFIGEGVYLYPNWGSPRAYRISQDKTGALSFFQPGEMNVLWTERAERQLFSGLVVDVVEKNGTYLISQLEEKYKQLVVPRLPLT